MDHFTGAGKVILKPGNLKSRQLSAFAVKHSCPPVAAAVKVWQLPYFVMASFLPICIRRFAAHPMFNIGSDHFPAAGKMVKRL